MSRITRTREGYEEFANEWIHGVEDRANYIRKFIAEFGQEALDAITVDRGPEPQPGIRYAYTQSLRFRI